MRLSFSFPFGPIAAVLIFIYTVDIHLWSHLTWLSGGLLGLALVILFLCSIEYKRD